MSLWAEIPLLFVVILGILIGLFGLLLVFFPGLTVIWGSILLWGAVTLFNYKVGPWTFTLTIATFLVITLLMLFGNIVDNIFMAGGARRKGASWWAIGLSWLVMISVSLFMSPIFNIFTPLVGLIAALLTLFLVEWLRVKDSGKAIRSTATMAMGCGWAVVARLVIATIMIGLAVMWYFVLYQR